MATLKALDGKMQMISGEGEFLYSDTQRFVEELKKYSTASSQYAVISIIGPQSSGKSYLLNTLFGTKFDVLNAAEGRKQTTKEIWISKCLNPCTIIMDVEGSDGRERGEDDTLFERRSALFSLTISDVLLLNIWFHDIGRVQGASYGLLKIIFEERVKIEAPKTTVIILVRDYDYETPTDITKKDIESSMNELWNKVHDTTNWKMSNYIQVIVKDFPNKSQKQEFAQKLAMSHYMCNKIKNEILCSLDQETMLQMLQLTFEKKLDELCTETLSTAKLKVRAELKNLRKLDESSIIDVIRPYMLSFDNNLPAEVPRDFLVIVTKYQKKVIEGVMKIAVEEAYDIQKERNIKKGLKFAGKIIFKTAWSVLTINPVGLVDVAGDIIGAAFN